MVCGLPGNIEVWGGNPAFVPAGGVHLTLPKVAAVAQQLGIPFAKAVVRGKWGGSFIIVACRV